MPKVLVEGKNVEITRMFRDNGWSTTSLLEEADLVCFQGGADVTPALYGERNTDSWNNEDTDFFSFVLYNNARRLGVPMVGICRGGQFLNVMAGGKMIQDYPGHAIYGTHEIAFADGYEDRGKVQVTSTHHQVMIPSDSCTLLAYGQNEKEAEIIYHDEEDTLSFQPHPEYVEKGHPCQELFFYLIDWYHSLRA